MTPHRDHRWVKSSYSNQDGGNCVEWAPGALSRGSVPVRDSKNPGPEIHFSVDAWAAFVKRIRRGGFPAV